MHRDARDLSTLVQPAMVAVFACWRADYARSVRWNGNALDPAGDMVATSLGCRGPANCGRARPAGHRPPI